MTTPSTTLRVDVNTPKELSPSLTEKTHLWNFLLTIVASLGHFMNQEYPVETQRFQEIPSLEDLHTGYYSTAYLFSTTLIKDFKLFIVSSRSSTYSALVDTLKNISQDMTLLLCTTVLQSPYYSSYFFFKDFTHLASLLENINAMSNYISTMHISLDAPIPKSREDMFCHTEKIISKYLSVKHILYKVFSSRILPLIELIELCGN